MKKIYINWERLRLLYVVASNKSLTKAALSLGKSVSTLSTLIRTFEQELGIKVFNRNEGALSLTEEGQRLYHLSQRMHYLVKAEEEILTSDVTRQGGHLKVLAPSGLLSKYISSFIDDFLMNHPELRLEFVPTNHLTHIEKINGEFLIHPFIQNLKNYHQEHLVRLELRLYASQEYLDTFGMPQSVQDLDRHRLIGFSNQSEQLIDGNWHLKAGLSNQEPRIPFLEIDENFDRCRLCARGAGIISVPKQHPELKIYNLVEVLPELFGPSIDYYVIIDERLHHYEKVQFFYKFLRDRFSKF